MFPFQAEESRKAGLDVSDDKMKVAFKAAFKDMVSRHPIYGLYSGLQSPDQWWTELIESSLKSAGVTNQTTLSTIMPTLAPTLLNRFSTVEAYKLAQGVPTIFQSLEQLRFQLTKTTTATPPTKSNGGNFFWNLATNSDSRILSVCQSLGLSEYLDVDIQGKQGQKDFNPPKTQNEKGGSARASEPSLSYFLGYEKPHAKFFHKAVQRSFSYIDSTNQISPSSQSSLSDLCAQTLYVGDDYREDYLGAKEAGLQAVWLKRSQPWPSELSQIERDKVTALHSMEELSDFIKESWS